MSSKPGGQLLHKVISDGFDTEFDTDLWAGSLQEAIQNINKQTIMQ
ncbi:MAG: hypothetical protein LC115_11610 [Bacteroidia bacterium]|nr:hypothetical protein [Bacteroidia bacterium]